MSQDKTDKTGEIYTPDFYDNTDFDCILTNLNLEKVDKSKYRLPPSEKERTDSILKRALAVEKGEVEPSSLTEEHPDGLDLSLYKEESQLKKKNATKRKPETPLKAEKSKEEKSPDKAKVKKVSPKKTPSKKNTGVKKTPVALKQSFSAEVKKSTPPSTSSVSSRAERAKKRQSTSTPATPPTKKSPVVDQKKAKVLAKVATKVSKNGTSKNTSATKSSVKTPTPSTSKVAATSKSSGKSVATPLSRSKRTRK